MKKSFLTSQTFILVLTMVTILLALTSCRSIDPAIADSAIRTDHATIHTHDTLIIHDSVFVSVLQKGDTVFRDRIEYRDRWRTQVIHDTIVRTDSIVQVIEHPPERYIPKFYKACTRILLLLLAVSILFFGIRLWKKLI